MRAVNLTEVAGGFRVAADSGRSQAAVMVLPSQAETGGPDTSHTASDQWLFVLSGTGRAVVGGEEVRLRPGLLLLIEAGETHELHSDAATTLRTVNIYSPAV